MKRETHDAHLARKYLEQLCAWLEDGRPLAEARQAIHAVTRVGPVALLAAGLACSSTGETQEPRGAAGSDGTQDGIEVCNNQTDDDNDGRIDCADADCQDDSLCSSPEASFEDCHNGKDDDADGDTDCADATCSNDPACTGTGGANAAPLEDCYNAKDDDADGDMDCADTSCADHPECAGVGGAYMAPFEDCHNGMDDDYDQLTDCDDPDCVGHELCPAD